MMRLLATLSLLLAPALAAAQQAQVPAAEVPAQLPNLTQTTRSASPDVSLCTAADLRGAWKLRNVIETPAGQYTESQKTAPHQYMYFDKSGIMYRLSDTKVVRRRDGLLRRMSEAQKKTKEVRQFMVGEKGAVFYYVNSQHTETWFCGRIKATMDPYIEGDLVLTPAQKTDGYSLYTTWKRPGFARSRFQQSTPNSQQPQNKKLN